MGLQPGITVIETFCWAICPKCKYEFRLDSATYRVTGREKLPPSILSLLPDSESVGNSPQAEKQHRHRAQYRKGKHTGDNPTVVS